MNFGEMKNKLAKTYDGIAKAITLTPGGHPEQGTEEYAMLSDREKILAKESSTPKYGNLLVASMPALMLLGAVAGGIGFASVGGVAMGAVAGLMVPPVIGVAGAVLGIAGAPTLATLWATAKASSFYQEAKQSILKIGPTKQNIEEKYKALSVGIAGLTGLGVAATQILPSVMAGGSLAGTLGGIFMAGATGGAVALGLGAVGYMAVNKVVMPHLIKTRNLQDDPVVAYTKEHKMPAAQKERVKSFEEFASVAGLDARKLDLDIYKMPGAPADTMPLWRAFNNPAEGHEPLSCRKGLAFQAGGFADAVEKLTILGHPANIEIPGLREEWEHRTKDLPEDKAARVAAHDYRVKNNCTLG